MPVEVDRAGARSKKGTVQKPSVKRSWSETAVLPLWFLGNSQKWAESFALDLAAPFGCPLLFTKIFNING